MQRFSARFVIQKKDLDSGKVIIKYYKGIREYWVYRQKETNLIDPEGNKLLGQDLKLYCIIACSDQDKPVTSENEHTFSIKGVRFTNDLDGNDLSDYLSKTNRGMNG